MACTKGYILSDNLSYSCERRNAPETCWSISLTASLLKYSLKLYTALSALARFDRHRREDIQNLVLYFSEAVDDVAELGELFDLLDGGGGFVFGWGGRAVADNKHAALGGGVGWEACC
jgi:hypothetical protein